MKFSCCILFVVAALVGCVSEHRASGDAYESSFGRFEEMRLRHRIQMAAFYELESWLRSNGDPKSLAEVFSALPGNPSERDEMINCWVNGMKGLTFDGQRYPLLPLIDGQADQNWAWHMTALPIGKGLVDMKTGRHAANRWWTLFHIVNCVAEEHGETYSTVDEFLATNDRKMADDVIYWLVHLATTKPEFSASPFWKTWQDERWNKRVTESRRFDSLHKPSFNCAEGAKACFDWDDIRNSPSSNAYEYLRFMSYSDDDNLDREAALWWAVTLTLHHKSSYGAVLLAEFRSRHALVPDSGFWLEASRRIDAMSQTDKIK